MKERYTERPAQTWIELLKEKPGAECILHFSENITEVQETDEEGILHTSYEADHYQIATSYREGILESAEANRAVWLEAAQAKEAEAENKTLKTRVRELEEADQIKGEIIDDILVSMLEG